MAGLEACLTSAQALDTLCVIKPGNHVGFGIAKTLVGATMTGLPFSIGSIYAGEIGLVGAGLLTLFPYLKDDLMKGSQIEPNSSLSRVVEVLDLVGKPVKICHTFFGDGVTSLLRPIYRRYPHEPDVPPLYYYRNGGFTKSPPRSPFDIRYGTRVIAVETGAGLSQLVGSLNEQEKPPYALMNGFVLGSSRQIPSAITAIHLVSGTLRGEGLTLAVHSGNYDLNAAKQTVMHPGSRICLMGTVSEVEGVVHLDLEMLQKALTQAVKLPAHRLPG